MRKGEVKTNWCSHCRVWRNGFGKRYERDGTKMGEIRRWEELGGEEKPMRLTEEVGKTDERKWKGRVKRREWKIRDKKQIKWMKGESNGGKIWVRVWKGKNRWHTKKHDSKNYEN